MQAMLLKMNVFLKNNHFLKYDNQQHLKLLLTIHSMRMLGRHNDGLAFMQLVSFAVDGDAADAVQAGNEGITAGFVGADLLVFVEGEKGNA